MCCYVIFVFFSTACCLEGRRAQIFHWRDTFLRLFKGSANILCCWRYRTITNEDSSRKNTPPTYCFLRLGIAKADPKEACWLPSSRGGSAGHEGCLLQHQRDQEADGEIGRSGTAAVPHRRLGGERGFLRKGKGKLQLFPNPGRSSTWRVKHYCIQIAALSSGGHKQGLGADWRLQRIFHASLTLYNGVLVWGGTGGAIYPRMVPRGMPAGTLPNQNRARRAYTTGRLKWETEEQERENGPRWGIPLSACQKATFPRPLQPRKKSHHSTLKTSPCWQNTTNPC